MTTMTSTQSRQRCQPAHGKATAALALFGALSFFGTACDRTYLSELERPLHTWSQLRGHCDVVRAVDGRREVWTNSGCEGDSVALSRSGAKAVAQYDQLVQTFQAFPDPANFPFGRSCDTASWYTFGAETDAAQPRFWTVCGGREEDDLTGVPEPFATAARLFLSP
jgi:hypothetical protein